jgi:HK97 family phage major capsid protein
MNADELRSKVAELRDEIEQLSTTEDITAEQDARLEEALDELEARKAELDAVEERAARIERARATEVRRTAGFDAPHVIRKVDTYDYDLRSLKDPTEKRDRVLRVLDDTSLTRHVSDAQVEAVERLVNSVDALSNRGHQEHFLATMRPEYMRGYAKKMTGYHEITSEELRALDEARAWSVGTDSSVIPELFDPQVALTNAGSINPFRQLGTIKTGTADVWEGLHSGGVTASWDGEAVEVSDDDPAFTRPTITAHKAAVFVPFSVEFQGDAAAVVAEIGMMFADAKERLESTAFATGSGTGQPKGVITALDAVTYAEITPTTDGLFGVEDLYKLMNNLSPRFRANSQWVASMNLANRIRAFGSALGHAYTVDLTGSYTFAPLGRPLYESSDYPAPATLTTGAQNLMTFGDHSKFFIYDRVGLNTEFIPHLFSTASGRPTGQRGIYGWWRTGSDMFFVGTTPPVLLLQNQ